MKFENDDELAKKFYEELHKEFVENNLTGDDVYSSMLKAVATVLANVFRVLWRY